jgi:hypothetical protein
VATYAVHIGGVAPHERVVRLTLQTDVEQEASRLAKMCVIIGLPFAESIANNDKLLPLLEARTNMLGGYPERVACCLYLMGHKAQSRAFTQDFAAKEPAYFQAFADAFLGMLSESNEQESR